eukprot:UN14269
MKGNFITYLEYYPHNGGWLICGFSSGTVIAWPVNKSTLKRNNSIQTP